MSIDTSLTVPQSVVWRGFAEKGASIWADSQSRFQGGIPVEKVRDELFGWEALEATLTATVLDEDGAMQVAVPKHKAIVRSDTGAVLGIHGATSYTVHQYREWLLTQVANLLDADLAIAGAGLFRGGALAFVQIEMAETLQVHGVEYRPYLTAATSHDGSIATTYTTGATVVVCTNTLAAALKSANRTKVKHTRNSGLAIADARSALEIVYQEAENFTEEVEALIAQRVTDEQWKTFVDAYTGLGVLDKKGVTEGRSRTIAERKAADLRFLYTEDEKAAPWAGTAWGVLAATSTARHHLDTVRGMERGERNTMSMVMGTHQAADQKALTLLNQVLAGA